MLNLVLVVETYLIYAFLDSKCEKARSVDEIFSARGARCLGDVWACHMGLRPKKLTALRIPSSLGGFQILPFAEPLAASLRRSVWQEQNDRGLTVFYGCQVWFEVRNLRLKS